MKEQKSNTIIMVRTQNTTIHTSGDKSREWRRHRNICKLRPRATQVHAPRLRFLVLNTVTDDNGPLADAILTMDVNMARFNTIFSDTEQGMKLLTQYCHLANVAEFDTQYSP
jgi:hypothetical protein